MPDKPKKQRKAKPEPMSDEQVRVIALGIFKGEIFTSRQIPERDVEQMLPMVFMPFLLMDKKALREMKAKKIVMLWGEMKNAFPRSINGYPMFHTMGCANEADAKRIVAKYNEIKSAIEGVE